MIIHNFDPVLVDLGFLQIRWYSIAYIGGVIFGWLYANKIIQESDQNKNESLAITKKKFEDLIFYLILGIILGGRLGYVIIYNLNYYNQHLLEIFKLWNGGMSFHGGLLGVIIATFIFAKYNKNYFFKLTDIICCAAPIGLFLGRIANFINGELYGKVSTLPWAVIFPNTEGTARHPSQIYEAFLEGLILFILINFFAIKKELLLKPGYTSGLFLVFYSILRIISEKFREPDEHLGYFINFISMGTLLSIITFFAGCIIIFTIKKNEQNN